MINTANKKGDEINEKLKIKKFILDIETKPDQNLIPMCEKVIEPSKVLKDPAKIEADIQSKKEGLRKKMSTDTDLAEIICIGIKELGGEGRLYTLEEMELWFLENKDFELITYNGKSFDLPLLIKVGLKNKLKFPYRKLKEMSRKWYFNGHYDLMESICESTWKSKDDICRIYLGIEPTPIDHNNATDEQEGIHCLEDLDQTESIYRVFEPML